LGLNAFGNWFNRDGNDEFAGGADRNWNIRFDHIRFEPVLEEFELKLEEASSRSSKMTGNKWKATSTKYHLILCRSCESDMTLRNAASKPIRPRAGVTRSVFLGWTKHKT